MSQYTYWRFLAAKYYFMICVSGTNKLDEKTWLTISGHQIIQKEGMAKNKASIRPPHNILLEF